MAVQSAAERRARWDAEKRIEAAERAARDRFAEDFNARPIRWGGWNLARLLRSTGERPARVAELRAALGALGLGDWRWPEQRGVFDHAEAWGRQGRPWCLVGHPYSLDDREREELARLAREFPTLCVSVDDRASHYGFGSHHVRIEVPSPLRPWSREDAPPPPVRPLRLFVPSARRPYKA